MAQQSSQSLGDEESNSTEQIERMWGAVLTCVAGVGLGAMVILGGNFVRVKNFSNPLNHVYASLFGAHTLIILTCLTGQIARFATGSIHLSYWACQAEGYLLSVGAQVTLGSIGQIGWERYNMVVRMQCWNLATHRRAIALTWMCSFALMAPLVAFEGNVHHRGTAMCCGNFASRDPRVLASIGIACVTYVGGALCMSMVSYFGIAHAILHARSSIIQATSSNQASSLATDGACRRAVKSLDLQLAAISLSVAMSFFLTWAIFFFGVAFPEQITGRHPAPHVEAVLWMMMSFYNCVWNVTLISVLDGELRAGIVVLWKGRRLPRCDTQDGASEKGPPSSFLEHERRPPDKLELSTPQPPRDVLQSMTLEI